MQVANRLSKTFASFEFHVSPYNSLPWPNLYRENDLLRATGQPNTVRDARTIKPKEPPVEILMDVEVVGYDGTASVCHVPMTAKTPKGPTRKVASQSKEPQPAAPAQAEIAGMS